MSDSLSRWRQPHDFRHEHEGVAESRLRWVIVLTVITMVAELFAGYAFGSMALVADGWHMGSHAAALSISVLGYVASRRLVGHARFTFGTGTIGPLAAYSSALLLGAVAVYMAVQSVERLVTPVPVRFDQALLVAVIGLAVNLACAWMLRHRPHEHDEADAGMHGTHAGHRHDHNLAAAYLHVLADALTSLLAIVALLGGKLYGWVALDAAMGLIGAVVIAHWSVGLIRRSGRVLLDAEDTGPLVERVRRLLEADPDTHVADLHVWRVGLQAYACIATVVSRGAASVETLKARIASVPQIRHVTIELNRRD